MPVYEYEQLSLHDQGDGNHRRYHWKSDRQGSLGPDDCLIQTLNERGREGWHVVAFTSDGHFGNKMILQRQIAEAGETASGHAPTERAAPVVIDGQPFAAALDQLRGELVEAAAVQSEAIRHDLPLALTVAMEALVEQQAGQAIQQAGAIRQMETRLAAALEEVRLAVVPPVPVQPEAAPPVRNPLRWPFGFRRSLSRPSPQVPS